MENEKVRQMPWCTISLVVLACTCQVCVLVGNMKTAGALEKIGESTAGWSGVGIDLSKSLRTELDEVMTNLTGMLTDTINHTLFVQDLLQTVLGLAGNATDSLMQSGATKAVLLLQEHVGSKALDQQPEPKESLGFAAAIVNAVNQVLDMLMVQVRQAIADLMKKIKPALEQVGQFMVKFGDKIQTVIAGFSVTLDRVQKLFDQIMASAVGGGDEEQQAVVQENTFTLYDVSNTGFVNKEDLKNIANLYGIPALQGKKSEELVDKYDQDGDGRLDKAEYALFSNDPDLPNVMAVVLRTYARRLSEVAGNVAAAQFRDEIATSVVNYLELVCAKNQTKVGWVADALSNGSLPIEFTADIMAELALQADDTDRLTTTGVGASVISKMTELNKENTMSAYKRLKNSTYWVSEGYDPADQDAVLKKLAEWTSAAGLLEMGSEVGEKSMKDTLELHELSRDIVHNKLFESRSAQSMLIHLGGSMMADSSGSSTAERVIKAGVPAMPETLLFAKRLAANASRTAQELQKACFDSTSQSSNAVDSFATQMHGMVKKIQGFLQMMESYATPAGIQQLEDLASNFTEEATNDLLKIAKNEVGTRFNSSANKLDDAVNNAIKTASGTFSSKLGELLGNPLGQMLGPSVADILAGLVGNESANKIGGQLGNVLGGEISKFSSQELEKELHDLLGKMVKDALSESSNLVNSTLQKMPRYGGSLLQIPEDVLLQEDALSMGSRLREGGAAAFGAHGPMDVVGQLSGVWEQMTSQLKSFVNLLPQATQSLKLARKEVSTLSSNLDSLFQVFSIKGLDTFVQISNQWRTIWIGYFFLVTIPTLSLLFYAFWAQGFFGGPGTPISAASEEMPEPDEADKTLSWRVQNFCSSCSYCCVEAHDSHLCFWSFLLLLQVFVLVLFLVTTLLSMLAALKVFLADGCDQIHVLQDLVYCGQTMTTIRSFLSTFYDSQDETMDAVCENHKLLTCEVIGPDMAASATLTVLFSFLACLIFFQLLVESGLNHTRAVHRRKIAKLKI
mmetsp:Transcript_125578/g.217722  ORF Transcript_125578/g.217722 Transcript_125578/m.217722 type:complete len:1021 (-) Transcript_125578:236-3298(-)